MSLEAIELHLHLHLLFLPAFTEIYMTLLEGKIAESTLLGIPMGKSDGLTVKLWYVINAIDLLRISMQFGSDEDLSGCVGQCSNRPEIAWAAAYCR
ncbi:hypothetical protein POTOM_003215 [Populus tomentosa]|uniref:Uncharacterized protein n=1 Tax=Populus tomentosa TaxID=118781 RepID=A0A8X8DL28_POPTO|nr:hypothetical protein POTOM_003215 [Populus tomentosa]